MRSNVASEAFPYHFLPFTGKFALLHFSVGLNAQEHRQLKSIGNLNANCAPCPPVQRQTGLEHVVQGWVQCGEQSWWFCRILWILDLPWVE